MAVLVTGLCVSSMEIIPITEAKARIAELADRVAREHDHFTLTRNGRAEVILISVAEYESTQETRGSRRVERPAGDPGGAGELDLSAQMLPPDRWPDVEASSRIRAGLKAWAVGCPLPIVIFFDEVDALTERSLVSFLNQIRDGYLARPARSSPRFAPPRDSVRSDDARAVSLPRRPSAARPAGPRSAAPAPPLSHSR